MKHPLCRQTVTLYRKTGDAVLRSVTENCFYSWEDCLTEDEEGRRFDRKFLLIAPGEILPGDRVMEGVGPAVSPEEWDAFLPVNVPTLSEVAYVKPRHFAGQLGHVEAGRK